MNPEKLVKWYKNASLLYACGAGITLGTVIYMTANSGSDLRPVGREETDPNATVYENSFWRVTVTQKETAFKTRIHNFFNPSGRRSESGSSEK